MTISALPPISGPTPVRSAERPTPAVERNDDFVVPGTETYDAARTAPRPVEPVRPVDPVAPRPEKSDGGKNAAVQASVSGTETVTVIPGATQVAVVAAPGTPDAAAALAGGGAQTATQNPNSATPPGRAGTPAAATAASPTAAPALVHAGILPVVPDGAGGHPAATPATAATQNAAVPAAEAALAPVAAQQALAAGNAIQTTRTANAAGSEKPAGRNGSGQATGDGAAVPGASAATAASAAASSASAPVAAAGTQGGTPAPSAAAPADNAQFIAQLMASGPQQAATPGGISLPQSLEAPGAAPSFQSEMKAALDAPAQAAAYTARGASTAQPAAQQIALQITRAIDQNADRLTVHLKPAELGKVTIDLEVRPDNRLIAVIAVERAETLELLQRDARSLEKALNDAGLKADSGSLEFSLQGDGNPFAGTDGEGDRNHTLDASIPLRGGEPGGALDATGNPLPQLVPDGRVDIHV